MKCFASTSRKMTQVFGVTAAIFVMSMALFAQINTGRILGTHNGPIRRRDCRRHGRSDQRGHRRGAKSGHGRRRRILCAQPQCGQIFGSGLGRGLPGVRAPEHRAGSWQGRRALTRSSRLARSLRRLQYPRAFLSWILPVPRSPEPSTPRPSPIIPLNGRNYQNLLQLRPGVTTEAWWRNADDFDQRASRRRTTITMSRDWITTSLSLGRASSIRRSPPGTRPRLCPLTPFRRSTSRPIRRRNSARGPAQSSTWASSRARTLSTARPSPSGAPTRSIRMSIASPRRSNHRPSWNSGAARLADPS